MRIAVDARCLSDPLTGIGRYTFELLQRMVQLGGEWFLYSHKPIIVANEFPEAVLRKGETRAQFSTPFAQSVFPRWARRDRIDVFWSPRHHLPLLLPRQTRKVLTIHDTVWALYPQTMRWTGRLLERSLMPASLSLADRIIAVSASTKADVGRLQPGALVRTRVIHEGARSWLRRGTGTESAPYMLFIGTLEPRKNLLRLLEAYARYAGEGGSHKLIIAGGAGWGCLDLGGEIVRLGLEGRVEGRGFVPDDELGDLITAADFFVMPSLYEGFGLPVLEAMKAGVPVLTSAGSAMAEVAGKAGLLVNPFSVDEIVDGMRRLSSDKALRRSLAAAGRERAALFTWDDAAQATWEVLAEW